MSLAQVQILELLTHADARGRLTVVEPPDSLPFAVARVFYLHHVAPGSVRGNHAHRWTEQVIVAVSGSFRLQLSDGRAHRSFQLNDPSRGIYIPPLIWDCLSDFSHDAVALVFASRPYNPADYVRTEEELLALNA